MYMSIYWIYKIWWSHYLLAARSQYTEMIWLHLLIAQYEIKFELTFAEKFISKMQSVYLQTTHHLLHNKFSYFIWPRYQHNIYGYDVGFIPTVI